MSLTRPNAKSISYQPNIIAIRQQYQRIPREPSYRPFRACVSISFPNPGRCPGLSPITPLGLKTNYPDQRVFRPIVAPVFRPNAAPVFPSRGHQSSAPKGHRSSAPTGPNVIAQGNALGERPDKNPKP